VLKIAFCKEKPEGGRFHIKGWSVIKPDLRLENGGRKGDTALNQMLMSLASRQGGARKVCRCETNRAALRSKRATKRGENPKHPGGGLILTASYNTTLVGQFCFKHRRGGGPGPQEACAGRSKRVRRLIAANVSRSEKKKKASNTQRDE